MPVLDHLLVASALTILSEGQRKGTFPRRFPLLCERSPGCGGEMHRWSCPLSGAEIYLSTVRLLMVAVSASGAVLLPDAEMCYCHRPFSGLLNVLADAVWNCAIILGVA